MLYRGELHDVVIGDGRLSAGQSQPLCYEISLPLHAGNEAADQQFNLTFRVVRP